MPFRTPLRARDLGVALVAAFVATLAGCSPSDVPGDDAAPPAPFAITAEMRATAQATTDVEAMLDALARIEGWHRRERTGGAEALRAGATIAQLDALEAALACRLPDDVRALWQWRDGQEAPGDGDELVWYHGLLPTERALAEYRDLLAAPWAEWDPSWVPVLYFQEEWYFVECTDVRVPASPLAHYFVEAGPQPAYASLTALFATNAEAMDAGAIVAEETGLSEDLRALAAIHAKHNPGIPFPYYVP